MPSAARTRTVSPGGHRTRIDARRSPSDRARTRSGAARATTTASATTTTTGTTTAPLLATPRWFPAVALIAAPVLGAVLGKALGGYHGPLFTLLTVAGAALATASATPNGRWWVIPALPPVAWLVAAAAELLWHDPPYRDTKAKAVGLVHATTHVFPVIVLAVVAMALVSVAAVAPANRPKRPRGGRRA